MENQPKINEMEQLKKDVTSLKKEVDKGKQKKKYKGFYALIVSSFILSITLFYTKYMIKNSFLKMDSSLTQTIQQNPIIGNIEYYFMLGGWFFLICGFILIIALIVVKKQLLQKMLGMTPKNPQPSNPQEIKK